MNVAELRISIVVATDENGGIGKNGTLPWKCPEDLQVFKARTMGHFVIVGRSTWEGMKSKLQGRQVIVLSKNPRYRSTKPIYAVSSCLEDAISLARSKGEREVFIIGGQSVYTASMKIANTMYISRISGVYSCDTFFPVIDVNEWTLESVESPYPGECFFYVCVYRR